MEHSLPIQNQSDIIISIDKRLAQLEQERSEIERKYGIDDNVLNSFSFSDKFIQFPSHLTKPIPKPTKIPYETITKINPQYKPKEIKINYKTPENLINSLKHEPNITDLKDKEIFEPSYAHLNTLKSKPTLPHGYDITQYIQDNINKDYMEETLY